jgi:hypothetical protein
MSQPVGRRLPLTLPRRFICDLLHFARKVPSVPVQRRMSLAEVVAAREAARPRPSWCAIFTKAYALVSAANPLLRRAYLSFPRPHLYEHAENVATVAVERPYRGEQAVFFCSLRRPEAMTLAEIDARLRRYKENPVENIGSLRRALRISRWPRPLRRLVWWFGLNGSGPLRARYAGTFGVTVYAGLGAASLHPLSVLTSTLSYGVIGDDGEVDVRLVYDHRVIDGGTVARSLAELERALRHEVLCELRYCQGCEAA